jgi:ATP-dependent RNA helicase DDX3X
LIATGVTARGIDFFDVGHVINFDLPSADHGGLVEYVHRIGRTARIGNQGVATSIYTDSDEGLAPKLTKLLIEAGQDVPDFLEQFKPKEGEPLDFEADELEAIHGEQNGGWGTDDNNGGDAWGNTGNSTGNATEAAELNEPTAW